MLMGERPPAGLLAQADGEPQPLLWAALELLGRAAPPQRERERNVRAGRDLQRLDLERAPQACQSKNPGQVWR